MLSIFHGTFRADQSNILLLTELMCALFLNSQPDHIAPAYRTAIALSTFRGRSIHIWTTKNKPNISFTWWQPRQLKVWQPKFASQLFYCKYTLCTYIKLLWLRKKSRLRIYKVFTPVKFAIIFQLETLAGCTVFWTTQIVSSFSRTIIW